MKREYVMWLIIAVLVVGALLLGTQKADSMAIDFEASTGDQNISFGEVTALEGLGTRSICSWFKIESNTSFGHLFNINTAISDDLTDGGYNILLPSGKIRFVPMWTGGAAAWDSDAALSTATEYLVCITYDSSSTANNPIFYVNGSSVTLTEIAAPSGTLIDKSTTTPITKFGNGVTGDSNTRFDGIIRDIRVYNRILTAAEAAQMYSARGRDNIRNGLVFCPFLKGAAGLQAFDGATLAAGNTIVDPCSGAVGVPAGSPVGVGETYLR